MRIPLTGRLLYSFPIPSFRVSLCRLRFPCYAIYSFLVLSSDNTSQSFVMRCSGSTIGCHRYTILTICDFPLARTNLNEIVYFGVIVFIGNLLLYNNHICQPKSYPKRKAQRGAYNERAKSIPCRHTKENFERTHLYTILTLGLTNSHRFFPQPGNSSIGRAYIPLGTKANVYSFSKIRILSEPMPL